MLPAALYVSVDGVPAIGVGQLASIAKSCRFDPCLDSPIARLACPPRFASWTVAVGHEPESLSDVERADARSRETTRPDGVVFRFQVIAKTVEPPVGNRAFNLFTKDDWRSALAEEVVPRRPKVARIVPASLGAGRREGLTGTTAGPDGTIVGPSGESERVAPATEAGEEMALDEPAHVSGPNKFD